MIEYTMLEPTNYCNLNCKFCNRKFVVKNQKHINLKDWCTILRKLSNQPLRVMKMQGLGESYLHPKIDKIVDHIRKVFPDIYLISATNCQYNINSKIEKAFKNVSLLYLSVDGFEETYEKFRVGAKWSRLIKFLDDLKELNHGKTEITINYVVNQDNYKDIKKLHNFIDTKYPFISEIRLNIAQWWSENERIIETYSDDFYTILRKYKENVKGKTPWTWSDCWWPKTGFIADVFGDVRICLLNTTTEPIGNILRQPLKEIMNSPKRINILNKCLENEPLVHCQSCDYKRLSPILGRIK